MIEETTLAPAPVSGLVGRWSFNEGAGTNVSDISGNGRHGINAQASGWVSAVLGSGLKSVAGAPQVSIPHHSSLTAGNVMTVTFWMRKNAEGTSRLVGKGISSAVENYGVWTDTADGKLRFKFYSGSGAQAVSGTTSLAQNQWYHVAVELNATAAAGSVKFFINGVLESTQIVNGFPVTSSDPLTIGYAGYGSGFSGDMDDVCLYNRLLTDSEISGLADRTGAGVNCRYTLGTQLISQERRTDSNSSTWTASYYGHDGLGSTRALYNGSGVATDTYNYTAYGKMLKILPESGGTVNNYLFAGEQWDPDIKLYYNRARYLNVDSGRFTSRDTFDGGAGDTANLHRYLYVGNNPLNKIDPSGHDGEFASLLGAMGVEEILQSMKGVRDVAIRQGMKEFQREMWNDLSFKDLPENQQLGLLGEAAWVAYLRTRGIKAVSVHESVSANGPDIVAYAQRNGRIMLIIGEVKATRKVPGLGLLRKLQNNVRQMSSNWLDRYSSALANAAFKVGLSYLPEQIIPAIKRGEVDLYLMSAAKSLVGDNWDLKGFRILHVNGDDDDVTIDSGGLDEIISPTTYYHPSK